MSKLTQKQKLFILEYLKDLNATQAAIRAGYSEKGAEVQGHHLLRNPKIKVVIQQSMDKRSDRIKIDADLVLQEIARIAFADLRDVMDWDGDSVTLKASSELTDAQAAAVCEVTQTITKDGGTLRLKLHSKDSSLEKLGKHLKLFTEVHEHHNFTDLSDDDLDRQITLLERTREQPSLPH